MDFNFGNLSNQNFTSTSTQHLRPYGIYNVTLTKIEKTMLKGSKDPNATYPVVALEFTGCGEDKGVFTTNLFIPTTKEDTERPTFKNAEGHEYNRPSRFENFQFTLMQIVHAINPAGEEKIKANSSKIKSVDQFIDLIIKAAANKETSTYLKLVGRNSNGVTYADLPRACGLNKAGELFPTNFIGDEDSLYFSNYELTQQKKYNEAKPTTMNDVNPDSDDSNDTELTDDFEL